jgi:hypothetical protein
MEFSFFSLVSKETKNLCWIILFRSKGTASETDNVLFEAYGNDASSQMKTYKWLKYVKNERISMANVGQLGWPSRLELAQVKNINYGNHRLTDQEVAVFIGSCHIILMEDLEIYQVSEKCVPRLPTNDQKQQQLSISENILLMSLLVTRQGFKVMT